METSALLHHRILFLSEPISPAVENQLVAQLLLLDSGDHNAPVDLYTNSPSGSLTDGFAIIDATDLTNISNWTAGVKATVQGESVTPFTLHTSRPRWLPTRTPPGRSVIYPGGNMVGRARRSNGRSN